MRQAIISCQKYCFEKHLIKELDNGLLGSSHARRYVEARNLITQPCDFLLCNQRSQRLFQEKFNWALLERGIPAWCESTLITARGKS